jgi:hypothetical protein
VFWAALAGLLAGLGLVLLWALSRDVPTGQKQLQPPVEAAVAPETAPPAPPEPSKPPEPSAPPETEKPPGMAPDPVEPVRQAEYGYLRVDTEPWSDVYLGRRKLGVTPILRRKMQVGKYRLTFVNPSEGIKKSFTVRIQPGKTTKVVKKLAP